MTLLVCGDTHITIDSIEELRDIFQEVSTYGTKDTILVILGDMYDLKRPSPRETYFGTYSINFLKQYFKDIVLLTGNHAELEKELTNVDYLKFLNITVCDEYEISESKDNAGIFFGHFMTNVSKMQFGKEDKDRNIDALSEYKLVLLGHQHSFQKLTDTVFHLGSCRWTSYSEINDKEKYICKIDGDKVDFITLKSPFPMKEVNSIKELKEVNPKTKILLTYNSFEQYKNEIKEIGKWKDKFKKFKIKLDFQELQIMEYVKCKDGSDYETLFNTFLTSIKDAEVRKLLEESYNFIKEDTIQ